MRGQRRNYVTPRRVVGPHGGRNTCVKTILECPFHGQYEGKMLAISRERITPCQGCIDDQDWYRKGHRALIDEGTQPLTPELVLARAEEMAGHPLRMYRRG